MMTAPKNLQEEIVCAWAVGGRKQQAGSLGSECMQDSTLEQRRRPQPCIGDNENWYKLHPCDRCPILTALENENIRLFAGDPAATTTFGNIYPNADMKKRLQRVSAIANSLHPQNLDAIDAATYHLGPLTAADLAPALLPTAARRGQLRALDAQGLIRQIENGEVRQRD